MNTILFLHGFYASGSCIPANALKKEMEGKSLVITPDLPLHPKEALDFIQDLCNQKQPDLLVGNSCGSFYAQIIASKNNIPALLGNPHLEMTLFLKDRIGKQQYKSPRSDGNQHFVIDQNLIDEFAEIENIQFSHITSKIKDKVWGLFGENDTLAHYEPLFLKYYNQSFHFPGNHTPTANEIKEWYVPLIQTMLNNLYLKR